MLSRLMPVGVTSPLHQLLGAECAQFVPTVDVDVSVDVCFRTPVVRLMPDAWMHARSPHPTRRLEILRRSKIWSGR